MDLMDFDIISCHETRADNPAKWVNPPLKQAPEGGTGYGVVCSDCNSIHPEAFIEQLKMGEFVAGFYWEDSQPTYVDTTRGRFYTEHLRDMSVQWLYGHAMTIFEHTGVVFFWDKEIIMWKSSGTNFRMGIDSANRISPQALLEAEDLIESNYYQGPPLC